MTDAFNHIHNRISRRWTEYVAMDHKVLSTKYSNRILGGRKSLFFRMSKDKMVKAMLVDEFGERAIVDYVAQCRDWDKHKKEVELLAK